MVVGAVRKAQSLPAPSCTLPEVEGFYQREIDEERGLILFRSPHGRRLLMESMAAGSAEAYLPLAEQFVTQSDPPLCGPSTIVMVLNSLQVDPLMVWKGPWRWYSEDMLRFCAPLDLSEGVTMEQFAHLAESNRADAEVFYAGEQGAALAPFRERLRSVLGDGESASRVVVSFDRGTLGQTGGGHYSPIAAYHEASDTALVMDVARFKYPPYWVPLTLLWRAMREADPATGRARGFFVLSRVREAARAAPGCSGGACGLRAGGCGLNARGACGGGATAAAAASAAAVAAARAGGSFAEGVLARLPAAAVVQGGPSLVQELVREALDAASASAEARRALGAFSRLLRAWLAEDARPVERALRRLRGSALGAEVRRLLAADARTAASSRELWAAHPQRAAELSALLPVALSSPLRRAAAGEAEAATGGGTAADGGAAAEEAGWRWCLALLEDALGGQPPEGRAELARMAAALSGLLGVAPPSE